MGESRIGVSGVLVATLGSCLLACCSCKAPRLGVGDNCRGQGGPPHFEPVEPEGTIDGEWTDDSPRSYDVSGTWSPPGIGRPWPPEEYLRDGGDRDLGVEVSPEWELRGLDTEDTIAHYDSMDGRTLVTPSNRVHLYAPRFGAVRAVVGAAGREQVDQLVGVLKDEKSAGAADVGIASSKLQRDRVTRQSSSTLAGAFLSRQGNGAVSINVGPGGFQDSFLPYEDLAAIRAGRFDASEHARLVAGAQAAITWTGDQSVKVLIDGVAASETSQVDKAGVIYSVKDERNSPKLRVVKVASTQTARPGELVEFTIRYDNVGDQTLGNIVLVDNLTTRLEFVADSAQSSLPAQFSSEPNEAQSRTIRWEIENDLEPGEGGIVRFLCKVR